MWSLLFTFQFTERVRFDCTEVCSKMYEAAKAAKCLKQQAEHGRK